MATTARSPSPPPPGPLPIRRLQESVINRIAAGEIIHRPASALKELIENSLDAGSTFIRITVKDGGMKLLQIQDNGCGIRKADLPILAERFTTSKLSTFADLSHLTTYGFRGEALASISYVAHLSVVTKTKTDTCAWKSSYADGALVPAKVGSPAEPRPCAGNDGTTITVENLFYNTPTRLSALRSSSEEYARILDVVTKYAVHNPHVSFTCKKAGSPTPDVSTPSGSTTAQAIRLLYGQTIAKDLLHVTVSSSSDDEGSGNANEDANSWSAEAHFTNAHYQAKKTVLLLFINHRLVESSRIKKAMEAIYNGILPKGASPFVYLSLQLDPHSVDVNVHPTKREVHFLNEDAIMERISDALQGKLVGESQSRVFEYQTLLTGGVAEVPRDKGKGKKRALDQEDRDDENEEMHEEGSSTPLSSIQQKKKVLSQHKVRTSLQDRTLDSMFAIVSPSQQASGGSGPSGPETPPNQVAKARDIKESLCYLTSVRNLRQAVVKGKHRQLSEILEKHTFVGIVDVSRCLSLIQHSTKLYLVNHGALAEELFYQLGLHQFGDLRRLKLDPAPSLRTLIALAVDVEEGIERSGLSKPQIVNRIVDTLVERREMLDEYFSLRISAEGVVESLPMLLRDYTPNLDKLPLFLMRLGPQVDWTSEKECFESFLRELAYFYVPEPLITPSATDADTELSEEEKAEDRSVQWQIQHVLFPAMARYLVAPKSLLDRDVVQVANLPDLYRVFERC
ncbi:DNA mismatch repair protein MutL [Laetiporus sulphureus 93-53]|uniref:DNA mismatch repair protein MutL n=1 Tax=Laetiporus sulphureus 93-53 TaxID=1314785 RepID=A0A165GG95_9APHY|nr:DNA mismatch repair protein MutL [Laetiporus sulphureus 93-53]KZT10305.1 DNA mismatch repair protein MutL [Laetiporus sulphureus 93-53]